jgi:methylmalonyl-CoA mutase N-terminal domain/subunit
VILFCFYAAAAEKQGVPLAQIQGTVQNDILKEYMAQHAWCFPIEPALRLIVDMFEWSRTHTPKWNTISISGYHIREAGATAAQELAFTLADGFTYVERGIARGLDVDDFAPRLSFFWDIHNDFFEEIAKLRAARRIWARRLRDKYGAKDPRSMVMRFHSQTAGVTLTAQQPINNVVRVAYQAMAAVLGGTQSLHTNSMDETLALPPRRACRWRCARSRSSPTRRACPTWPTRSAGRTTSRRSPTSSSATPSGCSRRSTRRAAWSRGSRRAGSSGASPRARPGSSGSSSSGGR